jgi:hypothetical protein
VRVGEIYCAAVRPQCATANILTSRTSADMTI